MADQNTKDYIDKYIGFYTTPEVKDRGKKLYKQGAVSLRLNQKELDIWSFSVEGSQLYKVQIRNLKNKNPETSCSCPYTWGSVCKHTVAALLYITDYNGDVEVSNEQVNVKDKLINKRDAIGYELSSFTKITEELINENTSIALLNRIKYACDALHITDIKVLNDTIEFYLDYRFNVEKVSFIYRDQKVFIYSSKTTLNSLTEIEAILLMKISRSATPNLFSLIFNKEHEQQSLQIMKSYGFNDYKDFNKYFRFGFNEEKGLYVVPSDVAQGIMHITNENDPLINNILTDLETDSELVFERNEFIREEREIGFVINLENPSYNNEEHYFSITSITGKPNKAKNKLSTYIEEYDSYQDEYNMIIPEHTKELLALTEENENDYSGMRQFEFQRRLINLLAKEKYVYLNSGKAYGIRKSDLKPVVVSAIPVDVFYKVHEDEQFVNLNLNLKLKDSVLDLSAIDKDKSGEFIYFINDILYTAKDYRAATLIADYTQAIKMVKTHKDVFLQKVIKPLSQHVSIDFDRDVYNIDRVELDFKKKQVYLSEKDNLLIIQPKVEYHQGVSVDLNTNADVLIEEQEALIQYIRNFELEDDFSESLAVLHPKFDAQKNNKIFFLDVNDFTQNMWFYRFFDALQMNNVEVYGLKELKSFKYSPHKGRISTSVSSGQDWFEVNVNVSFGNNQVKLSDIRKAVLNKQRYIKLSDGSVGVLPSEWLHKFEKYFRHGEVKDNTLSVSKLKFSIVDELFDNIDEEEVMLELVEKRNKLNAFKQIEQTTIPKSIKADLRPYQKEGLNWLNFLDDMGWGGILADDMGLGKTLQVLTFIQHINSKDKTSNLVIVPTTLLFNWENEIKKFAPGLKAMYHYGTGRATNTDEFSNFDLVFTTYGVLLRDVEMLSTYQFNYVILDESQAIKNPASRRFKAACLLKAKNRIALSGTPIENSTFDLFAQMNFVNRGFLGGVSAFKENFSNAIDREGDEKIAEELQRLINPFILRRTKEKVAGELPPKTEDVIFCEMDTAQRKVYDAYRNQYRDKLLGKIEDEGMGKSKLMVLEALTRLRQICDSPVLLNDDEISETESVKIKEIIQHITDRTSNHKILIFSQFVKMLGLLKEELVKRNIAFEYLDGQSTTKQREQSVNNFQENEDLRVFLISLKAGGTGLNLTAADYVYIIDPWWNPAVENQAIDRCYRIGQDKKVFAYRMICKNTIEEKILKLQEKKKKIAGDIVQTDENIMKTLKADDIRELFS